MSTRRSLDETRVLILDAGVELLTESGFSMIAHDFSLMDACRRAGLSTAGSGYKIWPSQNDFRTDVLRHMLKTDTESMLQVQRVIDAIASIDGDPGLSELIRVATQENASTTIGSTEFARYIALWSEAASDQMLEDLLVAEDRRMRHNVEALYSSLLELYHLEMVPPYEVATLSTAITAVIEGLSVGHRYARDVQIEDLKRPTGVDGALESWHLVGCMVEAIVDKFTRPVGGP